jgi:hypothetical protein
MDTPNYNWEEFDLGADERPAGRLHATLNARGLIRLNRWLYDKLGRPERAMLMFDRSTRSIGIRPATPDDKRPFTFKRHTTSSYRELWAKRFCSHYSIAPAQTIRFTEPRIESGILILDLNSVEAAIASNGKNAVSSER